MSLILKIEYIFEISLFLDSKIYFLLGTKLRLKTHNSKQKFLTFPIFSQHTKVALALVKKIIFFFTI